jgi:hypothetical protein
LKSLIESTEKELKEWKDRDSVPFNQRPHFSPIYTEQDILNWRNELETLEMTYEEPVLLNKDEDYE